MPSIAVEFPPGAVDMESLGSGVKENEREPLNPSADSHSLGDICSSIDVSIDPKPPLAQSVWPVPGLIGDPPVLFLRMRVIF